MQVTLNLTSKLEEDLTAAARARGLSLVDYLEEIATREAARLAGTFQSTGEERAQAFIKWAESFPTTASIPDEALDRSTMYPDRW